MLCMLLFFFFSFFLIKLQITPGLPVEERNSNNIEVMLYIGIYEMYTH